ncbi:MAG TPA: glycoside hydrolase [Firmicutes bacterium]|nr:glycoside hydrolase [Bacillota bacterium]
MNNQANIDQTSKDNSLLPAHFITDKATLSDPHGIYADCCRKFQGIPGIERTEAGSIYTVFYTGTETEGNGNFLLIHRCRDSDGKNACDLDFSETIMAVVPPTENTRCYDPCLWISPDKKLRLFWAQSCGWYDGRCGVWCSVCENPDADVPCFSAPERIANGIMMNKPTVLSSGEWLLPCAVWKVANSEYNYLPAERFSNVYRSTDSGKTYALYSHSDYPDRHFDEHMIYERRDGSLVMLIRAKNGIGEAFSYDRGKTFTGERDSGLGGPNSRFFVRRLKSGRLLLVNHVNFKGRNNLTALLSDDDGQSWKYSLLLDERGDVSYPDGVEGSDGYIYIIYDYNRNSDREILMAKLREEDIIAGRLVSDGSALKIVTNKAFG